MVKAVATLTARVLHAHREMAPCIHRIHTGFMVDANIQKVEKYLLSLHEMLCEVRTTLPTPNPITPPTVTQTHSLLRPTSFHADE